MSTVKPSSWRSPLGEEIQRYVRYKRALGHRYLVEESALRMLDRFLCERRVDQRSGVNPALIEAFLASRRRGDAAPRAATITFWASSAASSTGWSCRNALRTPRCESAPGAPVPGRCRFCSTPCWRSAFSTSPEPFPTARRVSVEDPPITSSSR